MTIKLCREPSYSFKVLKFDPLTKIGEELQIEQNARERLTDMTTGGRSSLTLPLIQIDIFHLRV